MKTNSIALALSVCAALLMAAPASAQRKHTSHKRTTVKRAPTSGAETSLAGIHLFDSGTRIVSIYGSPDSIEAVVLGGGTAGPGGGAAGGAGGLGLPGGRTAPGGGGGAPGPAPSVGLGPGSANIGPGDFQFGDTVLDNQTTRSLQPPKGKPSASGGSRTLAAPGAGGGVGPSLGGGGNSGGGGGMSAGGSTDRIDYTRWVYNRNASKYGFVLDRYNHVVQIEAIGIEAGKARTRRGITFGSTFAQIIKKYGAPDGYEIAGDNIVVRYLSKAKCAFRLNRLGENKPDVVTGIVVAAGKR